MRTDELGPGGGIEAITTLEDLGKHLQELRNKRRVTQLGLATRSGSKIARSRISEIENDSGRHPVTERELRVYLGGLQCTTRDIEQAVKVLKECAATLAKQSPDNPDATGPTTPHGYPAGLGGADDNPPPPEEKSDDNSAAATGKWHPRWKFAVAAISSVVIGIAGVTLFLANTGGKSFPLSHDIACRPRMPSEPQAQGEVRNLIDATYRLCLPHPGSWFYQTWTPTTVTAFTPSGQRAAEYFVHVNPDGFVELRITGPYEGNGKWSASWQQNPTSDCWNELIVTDPSGRQIEHSTETSCNPTH